MNAGQQEITAISAENHMIEQAKAKYISSKMLTESEKRVSSGGSAASSVLQPTLYLVGLLPSLGKKPCQMVCGCCIYGTYVVGR